MRAIRPGPANRGPLVQQTISPSPPIPFIPYLDATCKPSDDSRRLYLAPVAVVNALLIISSVVQTRDPSFQNQQTPLQTLADTSLSSPRVLLSANAGAPQVAQQLASAPAFRYQPLDTSLSTPKTLYQDALFAPSNMTESIPIIQWRDIGADTSQGMPLGLRGAQVANPFVPSFPLSAPVTNWLPPDTTRGSFLPLSAKPFVPQPWASVPVRPDIGPDISTRGTTTALLAGVPFAPAPQAFVDRIKWSGLDTSQGTFPARFPTVQAPFNPVQWSAPQQITWIPLDGSRGTSIVLLAKPFADYIHQYPQRAPDVVDISYGANLPLQTFVQRPFLPVQWSAPVVNTSQPADSSHGTSTPILKQLLVKPFNQSNWPAPIEYRVDWQQQWTFYGQPPSRIPPALPPGNMPNLLGRELWIQATAELIKAGITPNIGLLSQSVTSTPPLKYFGEVWPIVIVWQKSNVPPGIVIAQSPAPGSQVVFDATITLTVSAFPMGASTLFTGGSYGT